MSNDIDCDCGDCDCECGDCDCECDCWDCEFDCDFDCCHCDCNCFDCLSENNVIIFCCDSPRARETANKTNGAHAEPDCCSICCGPPRSRCFERRRANEGGGGFCGWRSWWCCCFARKEPPPPVRPAPGQDGRKELDKSGIKCHPMPPGEMRMSRTLMSIDCGSAGINKEQEHSKDHKKEEPGGVIK